MNRFYIFCFSLIFVIFFTSCNINDTGLKVLTWVKSVKGEQVDFEQYKSVSETAIEHQLWTTLLQKNVLENGNVDYEAFKKDSINLKEYLFLLSNNAPSDKWTEEEQLAYWINVYNAYTVKLIVDNLPVESIKDIGGSIPMINTPWDIKFFQIGGVNFDLNTVEHEILRKQFNEPRIHFAINCASVSCPKLLNEAYNAEKLEEQLSKQTQYFLYNPIKNKISKDKIQLSNIFNWFEKDFTKEGTIIQFLNNHLPKEEQINDTAITSFMDYNWQLNKQ